jgi:hypothetical protein
MIIVGAIFYVFLHSDSSISQRFFFDTFHATIHLRCYSTHRCGCHHLGLNIGNYLKFERHYSIFGKQTLEHTAWLWLLSWLKWYVEEIMLLRIDNLFL